MVTDEANNLRTALGKAIADARSGLADLTERCLEAEGRANDITAKLRTRWQRRIEILRTRANTDGAAKHLGLQ